jgi:hypothetical protein
MSDDPDKKRSEADAELEREIRKDRKFSLSEAIGRLAGPGAMKGASPVSRKQQAEAAIETWLRQHLSKPALETVLLRCVSQSELLLNNYDQPLIVLAAYCQKVLGSDRHLKELVRDCDEEWGRVFGERPHFDVEGAAPDPDDPYTAESVRRRLSGLIDELAAGEGSSG